VSRAQFLPAMIDTKERIEIQAIKKEELEKYFLS
jgi:hypothetical protein